MEEQLITDLRGDAGIIAVTGVFNSRPSIDWVTRPDTAALPGIAMQRVATDRLYIHGGEDTLTMARVQFDCFGATFASTATLYRALQAKMEAGGTGWRAFLVTQRDFAPEDTPGGERVFRKSADFNIWYEE